MVERVHRLKAAFEMPQALKPILFAGLELWKTSLESIPEDFLAKSSKQKDVFDGGPGIIFESVIVMCSTEVV